MKKIIICLVMIIVSFSSMAQPEVMWQWFTNGDILKWVYVGGDEFDDNTLDNEKWQDSYPWGRSLPQNNEQQYYLGNNIEESFGTLKLTAKEEPGTYVVVPYEAPSVILSDGMTNQRHYDYTSGMIFSKQKYKYGLFEIRFKLPWGSGFWPAFWLFGGIYSTPDECPQNSPCPQDEIDVFEVNCSNTERFKTGIVCPGCPNPGNFWNWHSDGNFPVENGEVGWWDVVGGLHENFNIMRVDWQPGLLYWSLNNQDFGYQFHDYIYPMNVIANLAIASDQGPFEPGVNSQTPFPSGFIIDYIRIWERIDCQETNFACYNSYDTQKQSKVTGGDVVLLGSDCPDEAIVISDDHLNVYATNSIKILPGFSAQTGSDFTAKIVDCPGPQMSPEFNQSMQDHTLSQLKLPDSDKTVNVINKNENQEILLEIFPNPAQGQLTIRVPGTIDMVDEISLLNMNGELVFSDRNINSKNIVIKPEHISSGVYILKIKIGNKLLNEKIVFN